MMLIRRVADAVPMLTTISCWLSVSVKESGATETKNQLSENFGATLASQPLLAEFRLRSQEHLLPISLSYTFEIPRNGTC